MNFSSHSTIFTARLSRHTLLVLLVLVVYTPVQAQTNSDVDAEKSMPLPYQSVLSGYQSFKEQDVADWRAINDEVEKIGGWRAYAKQARQPDVVDAPSVTPANTGNNLPRRQP